jgi:hypothetical protein
MYGMRLNHDIMLAPLRFSRVFIKSCVLGLVKCQVDNKPWLYYQNYSLVSTAGNVSRMTILVFGPHGVTDPYDLEQNDLL